MRLWKRILSEKKSIEMDERYVDSEPDDSELDDEEFLMAQEILGYDSCGSYTKQSCMNDCAFHIAMPTITTLN